MKIPVMAPILLAVALTLSAAAGPSEALAFFRALREDDPAKRGAALLELAVRDGYPAELALIHLTRNPLPPKSVARLLPAVRRRGGLAATVLLLRAYRAEDDASAAAPMDERELFELARREWRSAAKRELSGFEAPLFRELSGCVLYWACDCGEAAAMWREVEALVLAHGKAWHRAIPPAALLDYCHRLAFAAEGWEVFGKDAAETWKNSPHPGRRNFVRLLRELRNLPPPDEADTEALIGFFLAANSRKAAVQAAADLMRRQPKRSMGLFLYTAIAAGESGLVDKMKPLIKPEFMPLYRAMTLKGAGKYREALAAAKQIPAPEARAKVELECLIALGEFEAAGKLARNAVTPLPERTRILALLELAELSGDARYYRDAEQLAAKRIDRDAAWANSFGYVALVLGLDAEQAERRIRYALKCHPQNSSLLDSMAWALHRLGKPNEAWRYMDMALRRCRPQPESCEELEHAGAIRLALGDREGARKYYRLALKLAREGEAFTFGQARYRLHAKRIAAALEKLR